MIQFEEIKEVIVKNLSDAEVDVQDMTGTGDHLEITVKSKHFAGRPLLAQHRMIMDILQERFKADLHAVKLKTILKAE